MSFAEWLEDATPDRREVAVCLDRRLVSELVGARKHLEELRTANDGMLGKPTAGYEARVAELEERIREKTAGR